MSPDRPKAPGDERRVPTPCWEPFAEPELLARAASLAGSWRELKPKLPEDRRWFSGRLEATAVGRLVHVHCSLFRTLSAGTGAVLESARLLAGGARPAGEAAESAARIRALADDFRLERAGTLVLGTGDLSAGPFMLLDGNHRATALVLRRLRFPDAPAPSLPAVVALSGRAPAPW